MRTIDHGTFRVKTIIDDDGVQRLYLVSLTGSAPDAEIFETLEDASAPQLTCFGGAHNSIEITRTATAR